MITDNPTELLHGLRDLIGHEPNSLEEFIEEPRALQRGDIAAVVVIYTDGKASWYADIDHLGPHALDPHPADPTRCIICGGRHADIKCRLYEHDRVIPDKYTRYIPDDKDKYGDDK